jgi:hypothetical protein
MQLSDIPEFCRTDGVELKLFADDLKAYHISKSNIQFHLPFQNFFDKLKEYCSINSLQIAEKKCFTLHMGLSRKSVTITRGRGGGVGKKVQMVTKFIIGGGGGGGPGQLLTLPKLRLIFEF